MKVIVDIKNKTLKMLENERSIFKGEYSADKLELYINQQLENEYPVITGLLSNGRRIGAFTTDDGYEMETIDGVEYTKAKFTLSKENGFPLSAGVTQVTIWMYRTKDSVLVSKEAIGNVVFTVVDTTTFNDGDIIISGDVEGTVVNLKVELENLQGRLEKYLPLSGAKSMTGNLDMKGNNIIFDNDNEETIEIGEENNDYSMSIRMEDSDYYKAKYTASGFSIGNESINATLDISESRFEMSLDDKQAGLTPDGFSARKEGTSTSYEDGRITRYTDNYSKYAEIKLPNESGTVVVKDEEGDVVLQKSDDTYTAIGSTGNIVCRFESNSWIEMSAETQTFSVFDGNTSTDYRNGDIKCRIDGTWYTYNFPKKSGTVMLDTDIPTKTSQLINDSGYTTQDDLNDIVAIAQGKTKTYVIEASANSFLGTTSQEPLSLSNTLNLTTVDGKKVPFTDLIKGDVILITDTNLPDRFVGSIGEQVTFYPLESRKMDLDEYALKTEIPTKISQLEQDVELGVSEEDVMDIIENNAEQTETLEVENATEIAIGTSETFNPESDEQIPTSKAVSDLMAGAGGKLYRHKITTTWSSTNEYFVMICSYSEPFTADTLAEYLTNIGCIDSFNKFIIHPLDNVPYINYGIYNSDALRTNYNTLKVNIETNEITVSNGSGFFRISSDTVTEL